MQKLINAEDGIHILESDLIVPKGPSLARKGQLNPDADWAASERKLS